MGDSPYVNNFKVYENQSKFKEAYLRQNNVENSETLINATTLRGQGKLSYITFCTVPTYKRKSRTASPPSPYKRKEVLEDQKLIKS